MIGILQARISSSRLPGKALAALSGKPMLAQQMERLKRARALQDLWLSTSTEPSDDPLVDLARKMGIQCYRGSLLDVLDRFYHTAQASKASVVVRLTGDCPLIDPKVIDHLADFFQSGDYDYASNTITPTFPDGLDAEIVTVQALQQAWREAVLPSDREHVTSFIWRQPDRFRLGDFRQQRNLSHLRWTVDLPEDLAFVQEVYGHLYAKNPGFGMADVLELLNNHPALATLSSGQMRNEGYQRSLAQDPAPRSTPI